MEGRAGHTIIGFRLFTQKNCPIVTGERIEIDDCLTRQRRCGTESTESYKVQRKILFSYLDKFPIVLKLTTGDVGMPSTVR